MSGLVLVTGGTGKSGRRLIAQLRDEGIACRAASRGGDPPFDWAQPTTWAAALEGVTSIYLVAPTTLSDPYSAMLAFLRSATHQGGRRFVFLSVSPFPAGGPAHGQVHQWLKDHSEDWTVLRPTWFMQNFSEGQHLPTIRDEAAIYSATGEGRVPLISADDIARAARAALTHASALNDDFILTGDEAISYDRVAQLISHACGRRISHRAMSAEALTQWQLGRGLPERTAKILTSLDLAIAAGAEDRTTDAIEALTGKPPMTFEAFANANAGAWKRAG